MNDEDVRRILADDGLYDETREWSVRQTLGLLYNRQMVLPVIVMYVNVVIALAIAVVSALRFFRTDEVKDEILYATTFLVGVGWIGFIKVAAWVAMYRNSISREIKRLEVRVMAASDASRRESKS